jgi:hypothetical protein
MKEENAPQDPGIASPSEGADEASERRRLPSSAEGRLRRIRRELVLQLYLRRGPLWDAVHDLRARRDLSVKVQLPPAVRGSLLPEDAPDFDNREEYVKYAAKWGEEISRVRERGVPALDQDTRGLFDLELEASWEDFLSACVIYDPPEDRLIEFASYGDPEPTVFSGGRLPTVSNLEGLPEMVDPPIKTLADLMDVKDWFWHRVLDHIGKRYLEPQGVDVEALLENVIWDVPGLREEHLERYRRYSKRFYIEVDEYTTREDVEMAFHAVRAIKPQKGAKPPRDRLVALQCALLHDHLNVRKPGDKRKWRWTYETLAAEERFNLIGSRAAEDHVKLGREILAEEHLEDR